MTSGGNMRVLHLKRGKLTGINQIYVFCCSTHFEETDQNQKLNQNTSIYFHWAWTQQNNNFFFNFPSQKSDKSKTQCWTLACKTLYRQNILQLICAP